MIDRYARYCESNPTISYEDWLELDEVSISGLYVDTLDISMFPDGITSLTIKNGHVLKLTSSHKLPNLTRLIVKSVGLSELDIKNAVPKLSWLSLKDNRLTVASIPTANIYNLDLSDNLLTRIIMTPQRRHMISFDVSNNVMLTSLPKLGCYVNSLDVTGCPHLTVKGKSRFGNTVL